MLGENFPGPLPVLVLLAEELSALPIAFIQADLRSHADGCNPSRPVGYIEGMVCCGSLPAETSWSKTLEVDATSSRQSVCLDGYPHG